MEDGDLVPDELIVGGHRLAGEDPSAAAVANAIRSAMSDKTDPTTTLLQHGVGWVVVDREAGGPAPRSLMPGVTEEFSGPTVSVYRLAGTPAPQRPPVWRTVAVLAAWTAAVATLIAALVSLVRRCYSSVHLTGRGHVSWDH